MAELNNQPFHHVSHCNNMDVVRYYLSIYVLISHAVVLGGLDVWLPYSTVSAVGGFFALSGFLLFASFQRRPTWRHYISRRARRILPPYMLIVVVCAVLLVAVSSLPWQQYYSDSGFWKYLAANIGFMNFLHPDLPGVFQGPEYYTSAVNGSLWTMKGEWACYLSVPFVFGAIKRWPRYGGAILGSIIVASLACAAGCYHFLDTTGKGIFGVIGKQFGHLLVYFYVGAFINYYLPLLLKYKWYILPVSLMLILGGDYIPGYYLAIQPIATSTLVLWVSMVGSWGARLSRHDNVSYDIYLFHFPVIQLLVWGGVSKTVNPWVFILISLGLTTALAFVSWNLVGRRFAPKRR